MKELQKILDTLDKNFLKIKFIEKIAVYLIIFLVMGGIMYSIILPMNTKKIKILSTKVTKLENALKNSKAALKNNEEQKILLKEVERSNDSIKEEIENNKEALKYIKKKISQQHNIKFSADQWGRFFKEIQLKANKHKIKISRISNSEIQLKVPSTLNKETKQEYLKKSKQMFRPIFEIKLEAIGSFRNIMDFLLDVEKNKLITKINNMNIGINDGKTLKLSLELNLWGIK